MLSGVTWIEYFFALAGLSVLYYAWVVVKHFPDELRGIVKGEHLKGNGVSNTVFFQDELQEWENETNNEYDIIEESGDEDEFVQVEKLVNELTSAIEKATKKKTVKPEFKQILRMILREYPSIKDSEFRSSIDDLIISECNKHEAYTLSDKEVKVLWDS